MYSNEYSKLNRTAYKIAELCRRMKEKSSKNICLENVTKVMIKGKYDIIALQEATNWNKIYRILNKKSKIDYGYIHHKIYPEDMVTFYNKKLFKVEIIKVGDISRGKEDLRPYQIIFFKNKVNGNKYIIINIHNSHNQTKNNLSRELSYNLSKGIDVRKSKRKYKNSELWKEVDIRKYVKENIFEIILCGDMNEHRKLNLWKGFYPFEHSIYNNLKNIEVKSSKIPPKSCCVGEFSVRMGNHRDYTNGDYILISNGMKYSKNNTIVPEIFPASDHLPVYAIVKKKK